MGLLWPVAIEPPTIIGNRGKMQGASTVKAPATKDITNKVMLVA